MLDILGFILKNRNSILVIMVGLQIIETLNSKDKEKKIN